MARTSQFVCLLGLLACAACGGGGGGGEASAPAAPEAASVETPPTPAPTPAPAPQPAEAEAAEEGLTEERAEAEVAAPAAASAEAPPKDADPKPRGAPPPSAAAKPAAEAAPTPEPEVAAPGAAAEVSGPCGGDDEPACPLQAWMEKHLQLPFDDGDLAAVARGLRRSEALSPDSGWNGGERGWVTLAEEGAKAAEAGDAAATKRSCKGCHRAWRKRYRAEHRKRVIGD